MIVCKLYKSYNWNFLKFKRMVWDEFICYRILIGKLEIRIYNEKN